MAVSDQLAQATSNIDPTQWSCYLRPNMNTNLQSPANQRKYSTLVNSLLELRNLVDYAGINNIDEIVNAIFGSKGIQLQYSILGEMVKTSSKGDLLTFQTTMGRRQLTVTNVQNATLYDLSIEIANTSKIASVLSVGKGYWASFGSWTVAFIRDLPYSTIRSVNANYIDITGTDDFRATAQDYAENRSRLAYADLAEIYVDGMLVDADCTPGIAGEIKTGMLKFTGTISAGHKAVTV